MNYIQRKLSRVRSVHPLTKVVILLVAASHFAVGQEAEINYKEATDGSAALSFEGGGLKDSLALDLSGKSALFFESGGKRHRLQGAPESQSATTDAFMASWSAAGNEITIEVTRIDNGFHVSMRAPESEITRWGVSLSLDPNEYITGLMERVVTGGQGNSWREGMTEAMNLNGQIVDMIVEPTLGIYTPFHLSSRGYGLLVEGTWPGIYDIGKSDPHRLEMAFEGPSMAFQLTFADSPMELVQQHTLRVGPPVKLPKWAFGHWRWRDEHMIRNTYYDGAVRRPLQCRPRRRHPHDAALRHSQQRLLDRPSLGCLRGRDQ
jgi:alpha-D-xyloside xylohydrolase